MRAFAHERRAGIAEVAPGGWLRLDSLARWAQDVAWADVEDAGLRGLTLWLVRRTRIEARRLPRLDEPCLLRTYVTGLGRMWAERRTDVVPAGGGDPVARIACVWVHIDPERLLPSPVHEVEISTWTGPSTRPVKARLRHPAPAPGVAGTPWRLRGSELDVAAHINNAAYLTPLDEELIARGPHDPGGVDVEIEYRTPAQAGDASWRAAGAMRWLVGPGGEVHASAALHSWPT